MIYRNGSPFSAFGEQTMAEFLRKVETKLVAEIAAEKEMQILNVEEIEYIQYLTQKYSVDQLEIHFDRITYSKYELDVPAEWFPSSFHVYQGKTYRKTVIRLHVQFEGEPELLMCRPTISLSHTKEVAVINNELCFDIIDFYQKQENIAHEKSDFIGLISSQLKYIQSDVSGFNQRLPSIATSAFRARKQKIENESKMMSEMGISLRKSDVLSSPITVPVQRKRQIEFHKPPVKKGDFQDELSIDAKMYHDMLKLLDSFGSQFECLPSTYRRKTEEDIRDQFLIFLNGVLEIPSATGETFNKSGKTDILLKYEGRNVFVAECKYWTGRKNHLDAIDQLLGYLTWRDSKSALLVFVNRREFTSIVNKAKSAVKEHPSFVSEIAQDGEARFRFKFHLPDDPDRHIILALLLFHFPPVQKVNNSSQKPPAGE